MELTHVDILVSGCTAPYHRHRRLGKGILRQLFTDRKINLGLDQLKYNDRPC